MYTILPIHNDQMPASFIFNNLEDAIEGAKKDFDDPHTPETKGFMIVKIERTLGINRSLNEESVIEDFMAPEIAPPVEPKIVEDHNN